MYELTPHPDFTFNVGDVIVRIADSHHGIAALKKGKSDIKIASSSTQMGDGGTHNGNIVTQINNPSALMGHCTQMGDTGTHIGSNISQMSQPSAQMGINAAAVTQMGNHIAQIGTIGNNAGLPGAHLGDQTAIISTPGDHVRTSGTLVSNTNAHVGDPKMEIQELNQIQSSESNHMTAHASVDTASLHSCLHEPRTQSTGTNVPEPHPQANKGTHLASDRPSKSPITEPQASGVHGSRHRGTCQTRADEDKASVDLMNLANLKTVHAVAQAECTPVCGYKSSEIRSIRDEGLPCAGQVRLSCCA